jgi:DNA-binding GntR family transcriptional regulator
LSGARDYPPMKVASGTVGAIAARRSNSLAAIVQQEVERMIVGGDLAAGERINAQHLATRLGVSRGPVREALRALERTGLVQSITNLGTFVRKVGIEEVCEMYDMRAVVFGFACGQLADRIATKQVRILAVLVEQMTAAIAAEDPPEYYRLNLRFHDLVMEFSGHKRAEQIYQAMVREAHLFRQRSLQPVASMRESNEEHAAIVAALREGDREAARRESELHHLGGKRRWLVTLGPRQPDGRQGSETTGRRRR